MRVCEVCSNLRKKIVLERINGGSLCLERYWKMAVINISQKAEFEDTIRFVKNKFVMSHKVRLQVIYNFYFICLFSVQMT